MASTPSTSCVDGGDPPREIFGEARVVGLVDLEVGGAGLDQLPQFEIHHARDVAREGLLARVVLVADALHERVGAGDGDLDPPLGEPAQEPEILRQPEGRGGHPVADDAVVEVVVEALAGVVDLDAGQPHREVVDHVVATQLAVRDDVDAGDLLILDRRLDGHVVHLVQVVAADPALEVVVLHALEPAGHRVAADDGGGEQRFSHRSASLCD